MDCLVLNCSFADKVYFSEVSPRPHDTGLVTLVTQNLSEFALHVRAILGFPIPEIELITPGASRPLKVAESWRTTQLPVPSKHWLFRIRTAFWETGDQG